MTDFPHLFCHFLLFHFSNSSHLGSSVSPPLASFSHLSPAYSLASFRQQDSVGHSGPLGPWLPPLSSLRPSRSFRPTRSIAFFLSLSLASVQLGLSRSFRPTQSLAASVLVFTSLLSAFPPPPRLSRSFRPTRSLATSSLFLASALPLFHFVSPKPEPSRSFRPTRFLAASFLVLPLALPPLSPFSYFLSTARTQWVFPAHSAFCNLLSLPCFRLPPSFT